MNVKSLSYQAGSIWSLFSTSNKKISDINISIIFADIKNQSHYTR